MTKQEAERKVKELGLGLDGLRECASIFGELMESVADDAAERGTRVGRLGAWKQAFALLEKWCEVRS